MWNQQQTKVNVFGAAIMVALIFVCSIAAFAELTSSSTSVQFPSEPVGTTSAPMPVTITNTTNTRVVIQSAAMSLPQFSYSGSSFPITLGNGRSFTGFVTFTPTAAQTYSGTMTFTRKGALSLSVSLSGAGTQRVSTTLIASPSAMSFGARAGGAAPATQSLTIGENPAGAVPFAVSADQSWITLSATSGTTSSTIQVGANIGGLAAGNYSGHVTVSASGTTNSPVTVIVTHAVAAA
jgi:hypothetical protein